MFICFKRGAKLGYEIFVSRQKQCTERNVANENSDVLNWRIHFEKMRHTDGAV